MQHIEVYELYNVWYMPWWQTMYAKIAGFIVVLVVFAMLVYLLMRWLRAPKDVPYWQQALMQCKYLRSSSNTLDLPLVYVQLTSLLKRYLEARFKEPFTNLTDLELNAVVENLPLNDTQKKNIQEMLTYAVPVKFNSHLSELYDPIVHIGNLEQLIKETNPEAEPAEVR